MGIDSDSLGNLINDINVPIVYWVKNCLENMCC